MRLLSFDATSSDLHLCLSQAEEPKFSTIVYSAKQNREYAASRLISTIKESVKLIGWKPGDLQVVVVGIGPGSFTSIRVAVVTARTIAQALKLPLVGVSLFECYAFVSGGKTDNSKKGVALSAGRGNFFFAGYEIVKISGDYKDVSPIVEPSYGDVGQMIDHLQNLEHWLVDTQTRHLLVNQPERLQPLPEMDNIAQVQSEIAFNRVSLIMGRNPDPEFLLSAFSYTLVQPLYLRKASITLKGLI